MQKLTVFISSVQKEFAKERLQLFEHFRNDPLLSDFFEPVIFEKLPASSRAPNKVYLDEVGQSKVYLVLLGEEYGYEDAHGISPTEHEYNHARIHHLDCLAFIKGAIDLPRDEKQDKFIHKIQQHITYKRYAKPAGLVKEVNHALVALLKQKGLIQFTSFDDSLHPTATISDLSAEKIENFVRIAHAKRRFPLSLGINTEKFLTHLELLQNGRLYNSALLAFATNPQKFFTGAVTKCAHFHGLEMVKPIPDLKVFQGDIFEQTDQAVDFVLSKISVSVGARHAGNQAPIEYEIPPAVVSEAIINAVAHRKYSSNGSVQVMLFADRLEVTNPGTLAPELSIARLKKQHRSYPTNPKLAKIMYLKGYIEQFGTGTGDMYKYSKSAGLKEPEFDLEEGFKVIIWRPSANTGQVPDKYRTSTGQVPGKHRTSTVQVPYKYRASIEIERVLLVLDKEMKRTAIQEMLQLKHRPTFMENYLQAAIDEGVVEMTIPGKPNSPKQSYRLTAKGLLLQKALRENDK